MLIKQEPITAQKLGSRDLWRIANSVFNKLNLLCLLYSMVQRSCLLHKAKLYAKHLPKNSNIDNSVISLPVFPSRTYLKLHNISVTPKKVKKFIMSLDSSKASGPNCIPVVVLKKCKPELLYILAELFNMCLKSLVFKIVGRSHQWSLYLRMLGKGLQLETVDLLVLVFFERLVKSVKNLQIIGFLIT